MDARRQRRSSGWRPAFAAGIVGATVTTLIWSGCSLERDRETLSFFFDGVPEVLPPAATISEGSAAARRLVAGGVASAHSAYVERRCAECHGPNRFGFVTTGFSDVTDAVCIKCHAAVLDLPRQHGPLAAGACLVCHEAHVSRFPQLLVDESPALCLGCHLNELEDPPVDSSHSGPDDDCLSCHHAHGGSDRYFMRAPASRTDAPSDGDPTGTE